MWYPMGDGDGILKLHLVLLGPFFIRFGLSLLPYQTYKILKTEIKPVWHKLICKYKIIRKQLEYVIFLKTVELVHTLHLSCSESRYDEYNRVIFHLNLDE